MKLRLDCVSIFGLLTFCTNVFSIEDGFECVKRKSGACKVFNISDNFNNYIKLDIDEKESHHIIIEIDNEENKYSYEQGKIDRRNQFDIVDSPIVEILFTELELPGLFTFRLVLGQKLNRLAFLEQHGLKTNIIYNNYSPDLPAWPFAINVTIYNRLGATNLSVYRMDETDGMREPFLHGFLNDTSVQYISMRSRSKNVKLVGFYECSTKYEPYCGVEKKQLIVDCKKKISPLGSGLFNRFIDMSSFNRLNKGHYGIPTLFSEIFGVYRRNDNMHILFSSERFEKETYIAITIGDEIMIRMRTEKNGEYYEKTAIKKDWNQQPAQPYFVNVTISSETKRISLYNLDEHEPFISMDICNYYEYDDIQYMGVTSDKFKTVELYYDCCHPDQMENCHFSRRESSKYKRDLRVEVNNLSTTEENYEKVTDVVTVEPSDTTFSTPTTDDANDTTTMMDGEDNGEKENKEQEEAQKEGEEEERVEEDEEDEEEEGNVEITDYPMGMNLTKTYLNTSGFYNIEKIKYFYKDGESDLDLCPENVKTEDLKQSTESTYIQNYDDEDDSASYIDPKSLLSLIG